MAAMDAKGNAFLKAINEASLEQRAAMIASLDELKQQQLSEARNEAEIKYEEYLKTETAKLSSEDGVESAKRGAELKRQVIQARSEIADRVFSAVLSRLRDFTESGGYKDFLLNSAKAMTEKCGGEKLQIFVRKQDLKFEQEIKALSSSIVSVNEDSSVTIGGLYGICESKSIKLDDTLESRFEEEKNRFYETSGLTL
ncbi:MAG: hypothetical protein LUH40_09165 [Clostridiales bacterium]|nr:hypothetical protein [Clostridiales bacterium]